MQPFRRTIPTRYPRAEQVKRPASILYYARARVRHTCQMPASPQMEIVYTNMPIHPCIDSVVYRADLPWLRHSQAAAYARRGRGVQDACEPYLRQTRGEEPPAGRPDCYTILPLKLDICEYSSACFHLCVSSQSLYSRAYHIVDCGRSPTTMAYVRSSVPRPRAGLRSTTWSTRRIRYPVLDLPKSCHVTM